MRQTTSRTTYLITSETGRKYIAVVERIKNDINGHPRYKVEASKLDQLEEFGKATAYTFTTHDDFNGERGAVELVVNEIERRSQK